jgi:TonB family protein
MIPGSDWKRLCAALLVSCLLHAAFAFMPYLGASKTGFRPAQPGRTQPGPSRVLSVRVITETEPAAPVADSAAAGAGAAEPPLQDRTRGIDLLPIPAPTYYSADQLTKRPQPSSAPRLDVPEMGPIFASGKVILKLWINEFGNVISVDVEKSEMPEAVSASAAAAFAKLRFVPGEINGRPVGSMMRIEVTYDDGTGPPP